MKINNHSSRTLFVLFFSFLIFNISSCDSSDDDGENVKETDVFFETVEDFAITFDPNGEVSEAIREEAFNLYKAEDWANLEALFNENSLNNGFPPANGGFNIIDDVL